MNPEERREYQRKYRIKNRASIREYQRQWERDNRLKGLRKTLLILYGTFAASHWTLERSFGAHSIRFTG